VDGLQMPRQRNECNAHGVDTILATGEQVSRKEMNEYGDGNDADEIDDFQLGRFMIGMQERVSGYI
jgi:hypothetical protein